MTSTDLDSVSGGPSRSAGVTLSDADRLLRPGASRTAALLTLCAMQLMIILDGTIVSVALPTVQRSLGFSATGLAWVVNGYLVTFAGVLLLAGRLGDLYGVARIFTAGVVVFTAASVVCAVATSPAVLVSGRCLQGVGGALASAVILGMIVRLYPGQAEQARGVAVFSAVSAAGATLGLVSGGILTQTLGWRADFFVNLPIGVAVVTAVGLLFAAERPHRAGRGSDALGGLLVTAALSLGVLTLLRAAEIGWGSRLTVLTGVASFGSLLAFGLREASAPSPLLPLRIFRQRLLVVGDLVSLFVFAAGFGFQFLTALYLQRVLGMDPLQTGLAFLPVPVLIGVISMGVTTRLIARYGVRRVLRMGLGLLAAGLALLSPVPRAGGHLELVPALVLTGVAMGLTLPAVTMAAMSTDDPADAGLASGLANTTQQAGAAIGLAVIASVAAARTAAVSGRSTVDALCSGYRVGYLLAAGFALAGMAAVGLAKDARSQGRPSAR